MCMKTKYLYICISNIKTAAMKNYLVKNKITSQTVIVQAETPYHAVQLAARKLCAESNSFNDYCVKSV